MGPSSPAASAGNGEAFPVLRRRRRQRSRVVCSSTTALRVSAVLAFLRTDASRGLLLRSPPLRSRSKHPPGDSCPLRGSGFAMAAHHRERREGLLPTRHWSTSGEVDSDGDGGNAGGAVHTLLIDNYDSYTYNLFQQLAVINGRAPFVVYNDDEGGDLWKSIERMGRMPDNIVISPGPGRPDVVADFGMCAQALREATHIPVLGVCLGYEGLGIEHGAKVVRAREPMHGRLSPVFHDEDPLFRGVPQGASVVRYHSLVVDRATLPAGGPLKATAWTGDGVLMAMRHTEYPHWGVQFHPESVGTEHGSDIVRNFRDLTVDWRRALGRARGEGGAKASGTVPNGRATRIGGPGMANQSDRGKPAATASAFPAPEDEAGALESREGTSLATGERSRRRERPTARRRPFVLHVQEVAMAGGVDGGGGGENGVGQPAPAAPMPDTELAFRALHGDDPTAWWLDSSSQRPGLAVDGQAKARFTFMGGADGPLSELIECYGEDRLVVIQRGGGGKGDGGITVGKSERREVHANILDYLKARMAQMGHASGVASNDSLEIRMVGENVGGAGEEVLSGGGKGDRGSEGGGRTTLPFDFVGGFVGFLGYELRHEANDVLGRSAGGTEWDWQAPGGGQWDEETFEGKVTGSPDAVAGSAKVACGGEDAEAATRVGEGGGDVPLGFLVFVDRFVAFDHQEGKAYVLALVDASACDGELDVAGHREHVNGDAGVSSGPEADALNWIERTSNCLRSICLQTGEGWGPGSDSPRDASPPISDEAATTACSMDVPRSRYERSLEEIMRLVGEGETYEVCLTNQIVCERPGGGMTPPLDLYSRLRRSNPAPYAAYIVHDPHRRLSACSGSEPSTAGAGTGPAFAVCCSSPEKFLKVDGQGWAESKPIKGTVKRGKTPAEDVALATDLAKGEKNMAENLMIVDLVRNDLGRVCRTGSVSVPKLMHVESYATVHQLVSTIRGQLSPGCGALDAIAAAFPGGSMTGAPKQRTMEIIERLEEGRPRGVYSGSIGFLGVNGAADFNIVIRTAVVTPQNVTVGAGGAVIALSETDDEYEEMLLKATSVLGAIGHKNSRGRLGPLGSEPIPRGGTVEGGGIISSHGISAEKEEQAAEGCRGSIAPNGGGGRRAVVDPPSAVVGVQGPLAAATLTPRGVREGSKGGGGGATP